MKRASVAGVFTLCLGLTVACGGDRGDESAGDQQAAEGKSRPVEVTGCLTARGDQFVLTDLERAGGEGDRGAAGDQQAATESYQLVGNAEDLRAHVGKQVRVAGEAEPQQVAEVHETTPPATSGATGTAGQQGQSAQGSPQAQGSAQAQAGEQAQRSQQSGQPQVRTETETRMEVAKLRVQSVRPSGASCAAETTGGAKPQPGRQ